MLHKIRPKQFDNLKVKMLEIRKSMDVLKKAKIKRNEDEIDRVRHFLPDYLYEKFKEVSKL